MNELIKYFEALEARLAAQEERISKLERATAGMLPQLAEMMQNSDAIKEHLARMQEILDEAVKAQAEPEVEVDLVYPEDEEVTVVLPQEEQVVSTEATEQTEVPAHEPQPEPVVEQPAPEPVVEQPAPEPVVEPVVEPAVEPAAEPIVEPVIEQPKPEAPKMPQQTSLFGAPVTDIRQAVSIGDRFLFQRELFGGNAEQLQQVLTDINLLHSLDEALAYVDKFGWDKQTPTYELFVNALRRRFL